MPPGHGATVSFTFDDGPSPLATPRVVALLQAYRVPAVFCLIGRQATRYPSLVRVEAADGYRLCDHSRDHDLRMRFRGSAYQTGEVADGLAQIRSVAGGAPVRWYRQPGGFWTPAVVAAARQRGLALLRWNVDPRDWSRPGAVTIADRVLRRLAPGSVVLLHDGGGDRVQTLAALAWLLPHLRAAGWHFALPRVQPLSFGQAVQPQ